MMYFELIRLFICVSKILVGEAMSCNTHIKETQAAKRFANENDSMVSGSLYVIKTGTCLISCTLLEC